MRDTSNVGDFITLEATPGFKDIAEDVQDDILDGIPNYYPSMQVTPTIVANLMTLVKHPVFEKLQHEPPSVDAGTSLGAA